MNESISNGPVGIEPSRPRRTRRLLLRLSLVAAVVAVIMAIVGGYLAYSPVGDKEPAPLFAAKIVSKRIASEVLMMWHALVGYDVPMGAPSETVGPAQPALLTELPSVTVFAAQTTAQDFELARELADWLRSRTTYGSARRDYRSLSTSETLDEALTGQPFLCGDIVRLFVMLAPALDLEVRQVYLWTPTQSDNEVSNHVVAEVWSEDLGKWAVVDVQENIILTQGDGLPLDTVEVSDLVRAGRASGIQLVPNGERNLDSGYRKIHYLASYSTIGVLLRSDLQRMSTLSGYHPANLESQNVALYEPSGTLLPRLYYRQRVSAEQLAQPPAY